METGKFHQAESYSGLEKMIDKNEQMYLGDIISSDGKQTKNVLARTNKGLGIINQIIQILDSVFFGKYHFEVAMILRSSLLLSSILLNSEAWVNLSDKDVRSLEQTDENLLGKILGCDSNTSNVFKYLELGVCPIRFEIMKRKILFLQYILKQDKEAMIFKVLQATKENQIKNDFVQTCEKYLKNLKINMDFKEIGDMTTGMFKKLVKSKTIKAAFEYLIEKKNDQKKIRDIEYDNLEMQEYLSGGNRNTKVSQMIYKARGKTLDIKTHKKWKFEDDLCVGCDKNIETVEELLSCPSFGEHKSEMSYSQIFGNCVTDMVLVGKELKKRLTIRQKILDEPS